MGLISQTRTSLENPQTPLSFPAEWLLDIWNGGRTDSGIRVSEMTSLQLSTVYACVEIKAGAIGALDLRIFEKVINKDGRVQRRIAHDHDLWDLLEHEPNPEMSSFTLRKTVQCHRMLWGNGYIELQRDGGNRIIAMWPRNPARIRLRRAAQNMLVKDELVRRGEMFYATTEGVETESIDPESPVNNGMTGERAILPADMLHIPGLTLDGRVGQDVVELARNAIGLALATEKFGGKFFANGALGHGVFTWPTMMSPEDREIFKRSISESYGGENVNRPLVLEGGVTYASMSVDPDKAQALEVRKHQVQEICRIFSVPPHMVGDSEKQNRANTEQIGQEFVTFSLSPDLKAWEQEIKRKMFPPASMGRNAGRKFGVFFDTWPLTMPAANDLRQFIASMIQFGVFEPNDARERLNMNPLEGEASDSTWMPINMAPSQMIYDQPALPAPEQDDEESGDGADKSAKSKTKGKQKKKPKGTGGLQQAYSRMFRDAFGRVCTRSECDLMAFQRTFMPVLLSIGEDLDRIAAATFEADPDPDGLERSRFLAEYLKTMHHRYGNERWGHANGNSDAISATELRRAAQAIAGEVYRNAAMRHARTITEDIA